MLSSFSKMALILSSALICGVMGWRMEDHHDHFFLSPANTSGYDADSAAPAPPGTADANVLAVNRDEGSACFSAVRRFACALGFGCIGAAGGFCIGGCLTMGGGAGPAVLVVGGAATTVGAAVGAGAGVAAGRN